jgi:archaellum biogenesis ATPase FlaH
LKSNGENLILPNEILEPAIITHSLKDLSFFLKIKQYLFTSEKKKSYFSDSKYQRIFNSICIWYDKYKKFPKKKEMLLLIDKLEKDEAIKLLINSMIKEVYDGDPDEIDHDYLEEETTKFIKRNRVYEAYMLSQVDVENGNYDTLPDRFQEAISVNFDTDLGTSIRDIDLGIKEINSLDDDDVIPTDFSSIDADNVLDGGFRNEEIYVFAAIPGLGKTALLGNFAINAFLQGKNVLVYTFETSNKRLLTRYYSNLIEMSKKEIISDNDKTIDELKSVVDSTAGDIILKEYPANTTSSNDLLAHINELKMYKKWEPDIIIADYLLIMSTNNKSMSSDNSYKYYKTITEEFRNLCKLLKVPGVTATQINRSGQDERGGSKAITTSKDISESRGIYDTADFFATINQTAKDRDLGKIMIYIDKNRNGDKGAKVKMNIDYEHMRFTEV